MIAGGEGRLGFGGAVEPETEVALAQIGRQTGILNHILIGTSRKLIEGATSGKIAPESTGLEKKPTDQSAF